MLTYGIVVVPKNVSWRFRAVSDHAGKVYGAAPIDKKLGTAHNFCIWF